MVTSARGQLYALILETALSPLSLILSNLSFILFQTKVPLKHVVCPVCEVKEDNSFMHLEFSLDRYELKDGAH